jgi:hypothetical protein
VWHLPDALHPPPLPSSAREPADASFECAGPGAAVEFAVAVPAADGVVLDPTEQRVAHTVAAQQIVAVTTAQRVGLLVPNDHAVPGPGCRHAAGGIGTPGTRQTTRMEATREEVANE